MAEVCVVYLSEDESVVERLVNILRGEWSVWWARDIAHGDWETAVRKEIAKASAVVPVLSHHAKGERATIVKDEMAFARKKAKPILPFLIGNAEIPFGFGGLNYTSAYGWNGHEDDDGYRQLQSKLAATIHTERVEGQGQRKPRQARSRVVGPPRKPQNEHRELERPAQLLVGKKVLALPSFVFSVSSHETQVSPKEGASLLQFLGPGALLISAYDAWKYYRRDPVFRSTIETISESSDVLFLDSGNYEAYRKNDRWAPKGNPKGWSRDDFWSVARRLSPDIAFSFDSLNPAGKPRQIIDKVTRAFRGDERALLGRDFPLCPIVHLPKGFSRAIPEIASELLSGVADELDPLLIAIPERELGNGLLERVKTVRTIRKSLNTLGKYYPLHLLGTGNPLSMVAYATAGADLFDGLEWCRTVADYGSGYLFHFQHFDCFKDTLSNRIQDEKVRSIIEDPKASYGQQTLSYNVDYFKDLTRTMQNMIRAGQARTLLNNMVPNISTELLKAIYE